MAELGVYRDEQFSEVEFSTLCSEWIFLALGEFIRRTVCANILGTRALENGIVAILTKL